MTKDTDVCQILKPMEGDFKAQLDEIAADCENFEKAKAKLADEGRNLSISIVGAVKSGKSSLLNALLFDGENVLPKAATPMTAALTYIRYAPECRAEVEFFTEKEWEKMVEFAREYDRVYAESEQKLRAEDDLDFKRFGRRREITRDRVVKHSRGRLTEEYVAAKELVDGVSRSGLDVKRYLKKSEADVVRLTAASPTELVGKMADYVGANGKFTPIVCATSIYLNDERLKGYEIVDTPGTNDPVIFRGARTSASLGSTDAVIAVSPASQFFQQSDLELLSDLLPRKGINNFVLIASQYDRTVGEVEDEIDEDLDPADRLAEAVRHVFKKLAGNYHDRITQIAESAAKLNEGDKWAKLVGATPTCVSALAYSLSRHWDRLSSDERQDLAKLNELIEDYEFTDARELERFSNIEKVVGQLEDVKVRKAEIIADSIAKKTSGFRSGLAERIGFLRDRVNARVETLETNDVAQLKKKLKAQTAALKAGSERIMATFEESRYAAEKVFRDLLSAMRSARSQYAKLNVRTETTTEEYTHDKGCGFLWWRSLCGCRYETRTRTVRTRYANTYDAVNQVEAFVEEARQEIESAIARVIDRKVLKSRVSETVIDIVDGIGDSDLNLDLFRAQLQTAVNRIHIPEPDLGDLDYTRMITESFEGGEVKDDAVDKLERCQHQALRKVLDDLEKKLDEKKGEIATCLRTTGAAFADQLIDELKADAEGDIAELKDKENALKRFKSYQPIVEEALAACK